MNTALRSLRDGATSFAAYAVLSLIVFWPILDGQLLLQRDLLRLTYPLRWLSGQLWMSGAMPLWNSGAALGIPLLADPVAGVLDPGSVLFMLPIHPYIVGTLTLWARLVLAAVFMRRYLRITGQKSHAALLGGAVYLLSGVTIGIWTSLPWIHCWMYVPMAMTVPHLDGASRGRGIAAGAIFTLMLFDGMIEPTLFTIFLWSLELIRARRERAEWLTGIASFAGLALIQILPIAEMYLQSQRSGGLPILESLGNSVSPMELLAIFLPVTFISDLGGPAPAGMFAYSHPIFMGTYLGVSVVILAAFAAARTRAFPYIGILIMAIVFSMGKYLPGCVELFESLPLLGSFRYPVKFLFFLPPCSAVLVAMGVESVFDRSRDWRRQCVVCALALMIIPCGVGAFFITTDPTASGFFAMLRPSFLRGALHAASAFSAVTLIVMMRERLRSDHISILLLSCIVILDLGIAARRTVFFEPAALSAAPPLRSVIEEDWPRIITAIDDVFPDLQKPATRQNWNAMEVASGIPNYVRHTDGYGSYRRTVHSNWWFSHLSNSPEGLRFLGSLGVKYMVCDTPIFQKATADGWVSEAVDGRVGVFQNPHCLPEIRFYAGSNPPEHAEFLLAGDSAQLKGTRFLNGDLHLDVNIDTPGWIMRAESWAPGWHVSDGTTEIELGEFKIPLQWYYVKSPGTYSLKYRYLPASIIAGLLGSLISAMISVSCFIISSRNQH